MFCSIDRDAQLLANRIALLKQEEMKTWKKIEETKKRTNDISGLKKRNEEKVQKVSHTLSIVTKHDLIENLRYSIGARAEEAYQHQQLHAFKAKTRRKEKSIGRSSFAKERRSQTSQNDQGTKRAKKKIKQFQNCSRKQNEKSNWSTIQETCSNEN